MHGDVVFTIGGHATDPRPGHGELLDEFGSGVDRPGIEAVGGRQRDDIEIEWRSEELLEPVVRQRRRLRQEREDATAVIVDDDDAEIGVPTAVRSPVGHRWC